eukprot:scaffold523_cov237-Pinguiococcus_pyrenoidosus.AAC.7
MTSTTLDTSSPLPASSKQCANSSRKWRRLYTYMGFSWTRSSTEKYSTHAWSATSTCLGLLESLLNHGRRGFGGGQRSDEVFAVQDVALGFVRCEEPQHLGLGVGQVPFVGGHRRHERDVAQLQLRLFELHHVGEQLLLQANLGDREVHHAHLAEHLCVEDRVLQLRDEEQAERRVHLKLLMVQRHHRSGVVAFSPHKRLPQQHWIQHGMKRIHHAFQDERFALGDGGADHVGQVVGRGRGLGHAKLLAVLHGQDPLQRLALRVHQQRVSGPTEADDGALERRDVGRKPGRDPVEDVRLGAAEADEWVGHRVVGRGSRIRGDRRRQGAWDASFAHVALPGVAEDPPLLRWEGAQVAHDRGDVEAVAHDLVQPRLHDLGVLSPAESLRVQGLRDLAGVHQPRPHALHLSLQRALLLHRRFTLLLQRLDSLHHVRKLRPLLGQEGVGVAPLGRHVLVDVAVHVQSVDPHAEARGGLGHLSHRLHAHAGVVHIALELLQQRLPDPFLVVGLQEAHEIRPTQQLLGGVPVRRLSKERADRLHYFAHGLRRRLERLELQNFRLGQASQGFVRRLQRRHRSVQLRLRVRAERCRLGTLLRYGGLVAGDALLDGGGFLLVLLHLPDQGVGLGGLLLDERLLLVQLLLEVVHVQRRLLQLLHAVAKQAVALLRFRRLLGHHVAEVAHEVQEELGRCVQVPSAAALVQHARELHHVIVDLRTDAHDAALHRPRHRRRVVHHARRDRRHGRRGPVPHVVHRESGQQRREALDDLRQGSARGTHGQGDADVVSRAEAEEPGAAQGRIGKAHIHDLRAHGLHQVAVVFAGEQARHVAVLEQATHGLERREVPQLGVLEQEGDAGVLHARQRHGLAQPIGKRVRLLDNGGRAAAARHDLSGPDGSFLLALLLGRGERAALLLCFFCRRCHEGTVAAAEEVAAHVRRDPDERLAAGAAVADEQQRASLLAQHPRDPQDMLERVVEEDQAHARVRVGVVVGEHVGRGDTNVVNAHDARVRGLRPGLVAQRRVGLVEQLVGAPASPRHAEVSRQQVGHKRLQQQRVRLSDQSVAKDAAGLVCPETGDALDALKVPLHGGDAVRREDALQDARDVHETEDVLRLLGRRLEALGHQLVEVGAGGYQRLRQFLDVILQRLRQLLEDAGVDAVDGALAGLVERQDAEVPREARRQRRTRAARRTGSEGVDAVEDVAEHGVHGIVVSVALQHAAEHLDGRGVAKLVGLRNAHVVEEDDVDLAAGRAQHGLAPPDHFVLEEAAHQARAGVRGKGHLERMPARRGALEQRPLVAHAFRLLLRVKRKDIAHEHGLASAAHARQQHRSALVEVHHGDAADRQRRRRGHENVEHMRARVGLQTLGRLHRVPVAPGGRQHHLDSAAGRLLRSVRTGSAVVLGRLVIRLVREGVHLLVDRDVVVEDGAAARQEDGGVAAGLGQHISEEDVEAELLAVVQATAHSPDHGEGHELVQDGHALLRQLQVLERLHDGADASLDDETGAADELERVEVQEPALLRADVRNGRLKQDAAMVLQSLQQGRRPSIRGAVLQAVEDLSDAPRHLQTWVRQ